MNLSSCSKYSALLKMRQNFEIFSKFIKCGILSIRGRKGYRLLTSHQRGSSPRSRLQKWGCSYCWKGNLLFKIGYFSALILTETGPAGRQSFAYWYKLNLKIAIYSPDQTNHCNAVFSFSSYFQPTTLNHFETSILQ